MSERILVTGVNGFVGQHMARTLHEQGHTVVGTSRQATETDGLVGIIDDYVQADLSDPCDVEAINLESINAIINLAGLANNGQSANQRELYENVNVGVHTNLYDECLRQDTAPRIIAVSTGAVYDANQELPISEESDLVDLDKTSPYSISKQLMEESLQIYRDNGLRVIAARPFNHSGPGQLPGYLIPDLGEQIDEAVSKKQPLMTGNLEPRRDFTDVRDVARAYALLATLPEEQITHDVYNVCTGASVAGKEVLDALMESFGAQQLSVELDQSRIRANEVMDIFGSRDRITQDTGWEPKISVEQMITDYTLWLRARSNDL